MTSPVHARARSVAAVAAGGAIGAVLRYEIGIHFAQSSFPRTTLIVNLSGSFALGVLLALVLERWPPTTYARPFGAIGVLGGYTTFSTFAVESVRLIQAHRAGTALAYVVASLAGGCVAVWLGRAAVRSVGRR